MPVALAFQRFVTHPRSHVALCVQVLRDDGECSLGFWISLLYAVTLLSAYGGGGAGPPTLMGKAPPLGVIKRVGGEPVSVTYHSHFLFPTLRHLPDALEAEGERIQEGTFSFVQCDESNISTYAGTWSVVQKVVL